MLEDERVPDRIQVAAIDQGFFRRNQVLWLHATLPKNCTFITLCIVSIFRFRQLCVAARCKKPESYSGKNTALLGTCIGVTV